MSRSSLLTWIFVAFAALAAGIAPAAAAESGNAAGPWPEFDKESKIGILARFTPERVEPGQTATLEVRVTTAPTWHIYAMEGAEGGLPTTLDPIRMPQGWKPGKWVEPTPHPVVMPGIDLPLMTHEGQILFTRPVEIPADFPVGEYDIEGKMGYQVCTNQTCLIPTDIAYTATLAVGAAPTAGSSEGPADAADEGDSTKTTLEIEIDPAHNFGAVLTVDPKTVTPGAEAFLQVHIEVIPGWHIYSLQSNDPNIFTTKLGIDSLPDGLEWIEGKGWSGPDPKLYFQPGVPPTDVYEGRVTFTRPVRVADDLSKSDVTIEGTISAMACATQCLPQAHLPVSTSLTIDPDAGDATPQVAYTETEALTSGNEASSGPAKAGSEGLVRLLITAILGAMLSWIMPCVYPMIPITISFFGKVAEEKHANKVAVASSYGFGIAGTFILIGLAVGLLTMFVAESDRSGYANLGNVIATNPWINLVIGVVFVLFALSMFGMFTIQVPGWLLSKTDSAGRASGSAHVGAVLLGITFALASFTCTVPVVGLLLATAASGTASGLASSLFGMTVYGAVFAAPFVVLSLFPSALSNLPRAGGWMETVKVGFGFLELGVAIKFLWVPDLEWGIGMLSRPVVLALFILIGLAAIAYFLGFYKIGHGLPTKPMRVGVGRYAVALGTAAILVPIVLSLASAPSYQQVGLPGWVSVGLETVLPPAPAGDELAEKEGWIIDDYEQALAKAKAEGKALFIDFTGVFCSNCRAMENTVFREDPIDERLHRMVLSRLYVDKKGEKFADFAKMQVERYGVASQPYYVILDPKDETTLSEGGGYMGSDSFAQLLDKGLDAFAAQSNEVASSR